MNSLNLNTSSEIGLVKIHWLFVQHVCLWYYNNTYITNIKKPSVSIPVSAIRARSTYWRLGHCKGYPYQSLTQSPINLSRSNSHSANLRRTLPLRLQDMHSEIDTCLRGSLNPRTTHVLDKHTICIVLSQQICKHLKCVFCLNLKSFVHTTSLLSRSFFPKLSTITFL